MQRSHMSCSVRTTKLKSEQSSQSVDSIAAEETQSTAFRTAVLKIVTPLQGLDGGRFRTIVPDDEEKRKDPGFQVILPGQDIANSDNLDLAKQVLDRAWAKLTINFENDMLTYTTTFSNDEKPVRLRCKRELLIRNGFIADIRYFPRRAGVFRGGQVDGQKAWTWVRENSGVAVIDHGFRIPPYGQEDDDWLAVDADNAHNSRPWRSSISDALFPIPPELLNSGENPMLILPTNYQLVGAVFVELTPVGSRTEGDLITAMDRQGFLYNDAFEQFVDFVRGGIEFLAKEDRASLQRAPSATPKLQHGKRVTISNKRLGSLKKAQRFLGQRELDLLRSIPALRRSCRR